MISVKESVESIVKQSEFLEDGVASGLINLSALAREIQPQVAAATGKSVSNGAILMTLKRMHSLMLNKATELAASNLPINTVIHSGLTIFNFANSDSIVANYHFLHAAVAEQVDAFVIFIHGQSTVTLVVNSELESRVNETFLAERQLSKLQNLSSIAVKTDASNFTDLYYRITKSLAWEKVSLIEVISTGSELVFVVSDGDVERAFGLIKRSK